MTSKKKIEGIYIYGLVKDEEIVYVGKTVNLYNRIKGHAEDKEFDNFVILKELESEEGINEIEDRYIMYYDPKYNKTLNKNTTSYISLHEACGLYDLDYIKLAKELSLPYNKPVFSDKYDINKLNYILLLNEYLKTGKYSEFNKLKKRGGFSYGRI